MLTLLAQVAAVSSNKQQQERSCDTTLEDSSLSGVQLLQGRVNLRDPPRETSELDGPSSVTGFYHLPDDTSFNLSIEFQFLHIGKTGGSSLKSEFQDAVDLNRAEMLGHPWSMKATQSCTTRQPQNKYIFFVRAPVARYVSAWISRFRYGSPGHPEPDWTEAEKSAYGNFASPDELGCALSSSNSTTRELAVQAIQDISHTHMDLDFYWNGLENLKACISQVYFVGRTEHFDDDTSELVTRLRGDGVMLPGKFKKKSEHSTPKAFDELEQLGSCAVRNLRLWYHKDYEIIDYLTSVGKLETSYADEVRRADVPTKP